MKVLFFIAILLHFSNCFLFQALGGLLNTKLNLIGNLYGALLPGLFGNTGQASSNGGGLFSWLQPQGQQQQVAQQQVQTPTPVIIQQRNTQPQFTVNNNVNAQADRQPQIFTSNNFIDVPRNTFSITSDPNINFLTETDFIRNGILVRVPTNSQITSLVSLGNGLRIRQLVNALVNSNLRSRSVADALQNILAAMRSLINVYELSRTVRIRTIDPYQRQLRLLRSQLSDIRSGVTFRELNSFNVNQRALLDNTDALQRQYGTIRNEIQNLQSQILALRQQNMGTLDDLGRFVASRVAPSADIDTLNANIQQRQLRLQQIERKILDNSFIMDNARDTVRTFNRFGDLAPRQRQLELQALIKNLQNTIANVQNQSLNVILSYQDLANQYPNIARLVNSFYYKTFGITNSVGQQNILNYLNDVYRPSSRLLASARSSNLTPLSNFDFRSIDLLNSDWIDRFGMPEYVQDLLNRNFDVYNQNFICDPLSDQLLTYGGIIQDINGNILNVSGGRGQNFFIELGGCSRLEGLTKEICHRSAILYSAEASMSITTNQVRFIEPHMLFSIEKSVIIYQPINQLRHVF